MLNAIIRFSLQHRVLVTALSLFVLGYGAWKVYELPIDVFPDLNRPRVTVMTEAHGMAPEEVETLISIPMETALNGATDVLAVRSTSSVGLSVINVEFDWGTDIYNDRQIVAERLALVAETLPPDVKPQLAPVSSIMGQIMIIGLVSTDPDKVSPMELRTLADWEVRQRLLAISGVSQVFVMGGQRKQFQVLANPGDMLRLGVTMHEIETAVAESNENATGGYLDEQGPHELLVRSLGRIRTIDDLKNVVVKTRKGRPVLLRQVARVVEGPQIKRGDSAAFVRDETGQFIGGPAVVLTINKQPNADTRRVTSKIIEVLEDLEKSDQWKDVHVFSELYQQKAFIDLAMWNVIEALLIGGGLVVVILFIFLLNFRTTFITLTAIPLSIVITALVFKAFGLSINTMTLGGLAVAIGELVDDAIVGVENVFRRLRENRQRKDPQSPLLVAYRASIEVRNPIVFGTLIVVLVFIPLFALSGMEGRLFTPLGIAYIVSILSSLLVSLTLTPVLAYWLLPAARVMDREKDSPVLRGLKWLAGATIRLSLRAPVPILIVAVSVVGASVYGFFQLQSDFLPPFNEGAVQLNVSLPPGTSLKQTSEIAGRLEDRLKEYDDLQSFVRKTGRAELDEHAVSVNGTEIIATFDPDSSRSRKEILEDMRTAMADVPGVVGGVDQPLSHLISHMLSGVKAQVAVKLKGDDLVVLRREADAMKRAIEGVDGVDGVEGVEDLQVEQQTVIPQLRIEVDGHRLTNYGLRRNDVNEFVETAMQGEVVSQVLQGQQTFDLLVRLDEPYRENVEAVKRLSLDLPGGGKTKLESVADVYEAGGPNTVKRENVKRRIVLQCNTAGRGLVDVVQDIKVRLKPIEDELPAGYFVEYGGQFESQQSATRVIGILLVVALVGMFLVLYTLFRSVNLSLQVMFIALPAAFIGAVAALYITRQTLTVAAWVGIVALCGIASRNGILLIGHYMNLVRHEGETWSPEMIVRAGQERLAPVLMTALTSGIGLVPLAMAAGQPGKEILYPIATVIIGGLISSTALEFLVRPALFWTFGVNAARRVVEADGTVVMSEKDAQPVAE